MLGLVKKSSPDGLFKKSADQACELKVSETKKKSTRPQAGVENCSPSTTKSNRGRAEARVRVNSAGGSRGSGTRGRGGGVLTGSG